MNNLFIGLILGFLITAVTMDKYFVSKLETIQHGCSHYDPIDGSFKWNKP